MPTQKKKETVANLKDKLSKAKAFFLTDYRGLTHQQLEQLKRAVKRVQGEFVVVKNTLLKLALENSKIQITNVKELGSALRNPTAALFAYGDEITAVKELAQFIKSRELPKIKLGIFGEKLTTEADFHRLANLPNKDVLLARLVFQVKSPLYGLHHALNWNLQRLVMVLSNIKNKK